MNVEIVSIGTEILLGEIVDTNANHIARTLRDVGANLFFVTVVGDNLERITTTLKAGLQRSDLIITTGGLGPTVDDVTRQGVAAATGRELEFKQELLDQIADRFATFGVRMSENNRQQAYVPQGATIIENDVGTAPCYIVETDQGAIVSLPGVPREMKHILAKHVIPYIQQKTGAGRVIKALILKTAGIGESHLDEKIADLMTNANPTVGLAAHTGQTDIRITALADSEADADQMLTEMEAIVRARVDGYIYGTDKYPLEQALVDILNKSNQTITVFESGTNAALWSRLEATDNHTGVLKDGVSSAVIPEEDADSIEVLLEITLQKSEAQRGLAAADLCIGIGTRYDATAIVVCTANKTLKRSYTFGGSSGQAPDWAPTWGMSMAWRMIREQMEAANDT